MLMADPTPDRMPAGTIAERGRIVAHYATFDEVCVYARQLEE